MHDANRSDQGKPSWRVSYAGNDSGSGDEEEEDDGEDSGIYLNVVKSSTGSIFEAYNLKNITPVVPHCASVGTDGQETFRQSFLSKHPLPMEEFSSDSSMVSSNSGFSPGTATQASNESIKSLRGADPSQTSITRLAYAEGMDLDFISRSFFSYSYSYSLPDFVRVRINSMIKLTERASDLAASDPDDNVTSPTQEVFGPGKVGAVDSLLKFIREAKNFGPGSALIVAREGISNAQLLQACLKGLKLTARLLSSMVSPNAPPLDYQVLIPIMGYESRNPAMQEHMKEILAHGRKEGVDDTNQGESSDRKILKKVLEKEPDIFKDENALELMLTLSMPFLELTRAHDPAQAQAKRPSMLRRATSMVSVPTLTQNQQNSPTKYTCDPTPMFQYSSKKPMPNALFTTTSEAPYNVLSLNDMACLLFGTSQSAAMDQSVLGFFDEAHRNDVVERLKMASTKFMNKDGMMICGDIYDILKGNGTTGVASLCVEKSHKLLVWAVDALEAHIEELPFSQDFDRLQLESLKCPSVDLDSKQEEIIKKVRGRPSVLHPIALEISGRLCPALISKHVLGGLEKPLRTLRVRFLLNAATSVFIDTSFTIKHYNSTVLRNMLGFDLKDDLRGHHINELIPDFSKRLKSVLEACKVELTPGLIFPEHLFRQQACQYRRDFFSLWPKDTVCVHNADHERIWADIQVRVISESNIVVWLSFSRPKVDKNTNFFPSQLQLLTSAADLPTSHSSTDLSTRDSPVCSTASSDTGLSPFTEIEENPFPIGSRRRELKFDQLEVLEVLGAGAYGRVILAKSDLILRNGVFALKSVVKDRILVDTWTRDRVLGTVPNEIKVLNDLRQRNHPNIIRLLDFFEDEQYYHIAMNFHGNPSLDLFDFIEENAKITMPRAKHVYRQVTDAVSYLHANGIVHRDLKDENIMIDQEDNVRVIDFGSAAYIRQGPFDVFVGTVDYAAPEVLKGLAFEGPQQDVWALGILLYTLLQKEYPFYNVDEVMEAQLTLPDSLEPQCASLLHSLLEKDYNARPTAPMILASEWLRSV